MCRTREEEVDIDPERFLRKYFPSGFGGDVPFPGAGAGEEAVVLGELREPEGLVEAVKGVVGLGCWVTKKRAVVGWRAGLVQAVAAAFDEIAADVRAWGDPWWVATAEAQFEMDRFFAKYFLEGMYGRPMPRKTPKPVTVRGWVGNQAFRHQLVGVVQQIHGLSACWFTKEDGEESCIIGWGDRPVEELHRLEAEKAQRVADAERIRLEEEGRPWREALYPHFQYLRERLVHPQGPFCVNHLVGSWLVKCPRLEAEWGGKPGKMTLDIVDQPLSEHGVLAAMDLALFRGTMLIAPDSGKLGKLSDALSAYTSDDEARLPHGGYMVKKSSRAAGHKPPRVSDNRVSEVEPGLGRVVLHWMGRQVGEGDVEIDEDEENRNMGQLDLDLANRAAGRGTFVYPAFFGRNIPVEFWVYKISDQPRDVPEKWTHFCPEPSPEYEYAFWGHSGWRC
ncbi:hypothetical protein QBC39DRAFT_353956 [Podospora conica]|nr:hypothetical protein QBC39DRAFT_353956 [Schizothecium conicum]